MLDTIPTLTETDNDVTGENRGVSGSPDRVNPDGGSPIGVSANHYSITPQRNRRKARCTRCKTQMAKGEGFAVSYPLIGGGYYWCLPCCDREIEKGQMHAGIDVGYQIIEPEFKWEEPFLKASGPISWQEAVRMLVGEL
jgi:hypothetical protein